ncbi:MULTISPECIES: carotenoid biosynthesis protein [Pontibacillus]|uniref:Carotenoid biosynthesis protein n=1 Tax=Pontibacillus chungwhensis TaxID=265426 RepID=A0ABY8V595_9BACI|nr:MULTISPECIES: carotenoid biosynthesis protein [Pontibacillus]MCD5322474.1 carotenoid biosynthesis protein [Pontibacillus sp. HN14]WIF99759.1 carotenoid biosynthesis protein [Pontibacillus chungwhensis]
MVWIFRFFVFWYVCGFILLSFDLIPPALEWANAVFLIVAGSIGGIYFVKRFGGIIGSLYSLFIVAFSIAVEHFGVQYHLWFGSYHYEQDFGPMISGVPITIGFAWLMVIAGSHEIARVIAPQGKSFFLLFLLTGSLLAVSIDLILDPVAYHVKEYWIWDEPGMYYSIPFSNFMGWFFLSLLFHLIGYPAIVKSQSEPRWEFRMFLVFEGVQGMFVWLAILGQLWFASIVVGSVMFFTITFYIKKRRSL